MPVSEVPSAREQIDAEHEAEERRANGKAGLDARREPEDSSPPPVEELRVDGTAQLGMFKAGGKSPTSSSIRLSGGKIDVIDGKAFRKGDTIHFEGTAVVREVAQRDKPDAKTGIVVSAEQKHTAQITDITIRGAE